MTLSAPENLSDRKTRCRIHSRRTKDPCPNEAFDDLQICMAHMREIAAHWADVVRELTRASPALRKALIDEDAATLQSEECEP